MSPLPAAVARPVPGVLPVTAATGAALAARPSDEDGALVRYGSRPLFRPWYNPLPVMLAGVGWVAGLAPIVFALPEHLTCS